MSQSNPGANMIAIVIVIRAMSGAKNPIFVYFGILVIFSLSDMIKSVHIPRIRLLGPH